MPEDRFQNGPRIALIARKGSVANRILGIAKRGGLSIAFAASPEEVEEDHAIEESEFVILLAHPIESRDGSLLRRVRARFPYSKIVVCSDPIESRAIRGVADMGIDGLVWSTGLEKSLEPTLRAVHAGQMVLPREVLLSMQAPDLTNREKQTLSMVIMGLTNLEIAQKLFISENTVKSHLNTAYKKLGVHSRAEAQRLITDPDQGLGTGILAITALGLNRGRPPRTQKTE